MAGIFISYRRKDTGDFWAKRLAQVLAREFGGHQVFFDLASIAKGIDFEKKVQEAIQESVIVLIVIGQDFLRQEGKTGRPRIFEEDDPVRFEIKTALEHGKRIYPVLTDNTPMVSKETLPNDIRPLATRNALLLDKESDLAEIVAELSPFLHGGASVYTIGDRKFFKSDSDPSILYPKARTAWTVKLIETGWLADDRYGPGNLCHPKFPNYRFRFDLERGALLLESKKWKRRTRLSWSIKSIFPLIQPFASKDFGIGLPERLRRAATNPEGFLEEEGVIKKSGLRQYKKEGIPKPVLTLTSSFLSGTETQLADARMKARATRAAIKGEISIELVGQLFGSPGNCITFHPGGNLLAVAGQDIHLWNLDPGVTKPEILKGHTEVVTSLAFSRDGRLASSSYDHTIRIWDIAHRSEPMQIKRPGIFRKFHHTWRNTIHQLTWSADGRWIAGGVEDKDIPIWDSTTGKLHLQIPSQKVNNPARVAFHPTDPWLVTDNQDKKLGVYEQESGECISTIPVPFYAEGLAFSPDGSILAVSFFREPIHLFHFPSGQKLGQLLGHDPTGTDQLSTRICGLGFSADSRWLATIGTDERLLIWDVPQRKAAGEYLWRHNFSTSSGFPGLSWSPLISLLALPVDGGQVYILSIGPPDELQNK